VTICCARRRVNQLCSETTAAAIFDTARRYHGDCRWYLRLLVLMPDHLHMTIGIDGETLLSNIIRDFKRATARFGKVHWQRNFSITGFGKMRVSKKKRITFSKIQFERD
jgi:putative transposase